MRSKIQFCLNIASMYAQMHENLLWAGEIGTTLSTFALQPKVAVKTHESFDIPGNGGSGGLMVPQAPSAVRRHSTGNTTASEVAAVAMVASPAEYQPKPGPRGANGSMDMSAAAVAMQQQYGLLQISEGRRLKREYFIWNFSHPKVVTAFLKICCHPQNDHK